MKTLLCVTLFVFLGVSKAQQDFSPFMINAQRSPVAPYFAWINYFDAQNLGFFGGGALISNRHIVTAATNVHNFARVTVHMGSANRTAMREFAVQGSTSHNQYNPVSRENDIAIIRLVVQIVATADIHPIALPPQEVPNLVLPLENEEGQVAGLGFQSIASSGPNQFLYRGFQRTTNNIRCSAFYIVNVVSAFCAEDVVEGSNGCHGDVGNPFVISYRRRDMLAGILSIHPSCGLRAPAAYTRITAYRQWLTEQLAF